jgi:hypothetical protein
MEQNGKLEQRGRYLLNLRNEKMNKRDDEKNGKNRLFFWLIPIQNEIDAEQVISYQLSAISYDGLTKFCAGPVITDK